MIVSKFMETKTSHFSLFLFGRFFLFLRISRNWFFILNEWFSKENFCWLFEMIFRIILEIRLQEIFFYFRNCLENKLQIVFNLFGIEIARRYFPFGNWNCKKSIFFYFFGIILEMKLEGEYFEILKLFGNKIKRTISLDFWNYFWN